MDSQAQEVIEKEYKNDANFPEPIGYRTDKRGNILNSNGGGIMLYAYSNYIGKDGSFKLKSSEYKWNDDGSLTIYSGKRLAIYDTTVQGDTGDYCRALYFSPACETHQRQLYGIFPDDGSCSAKGNFARKHIFS